MKTILLNTSLNFHPNRSHDWSGGCHDTLSWRHSRTFGLWTSDRSLSCSFEHMWLHGRVWLEDNIVSTSFRKSEPPG